MAVEVDKDRAVCVEELVVHRDERGSVFEPLEPELISVQRNVHVVLTEPGCVRGNHYHKVGMESVAVSGPALIRIRGREGIQDITIPENKVIRLTIPPGVSHAFQNTGRRANVLVAFNTLLNDPGNRDVFQDVLIES